MRGYEGAYEVSNLGRVRSLDRRVPSNTGRRTQAGQVITPGKRGKGYLAFRANGAGARPNRSISAHVAVAEAFLGPCPPGMQVDHIDGDKTNNAAANLRYATGSENVRAAHAAGRNKSGITDADVVFIRQMRKAGVPQSYLAAYFGVHQATISKFQTGRFRPDAR